MHTETHTGTRTEIPAEKLTEIHTKKHIEKHTEYECIPEKEKCDRLSRQSHPLHNGIIRELPVRGLS